MVLVFCETNTVRVTYIFQFILKELCGFEYAVTTNVQDYVSYEGPTLNYSPKNLKPNDIEIAPNGLLLLQTITPCEGWINQDNMQVQLFLKGPGLNENLFDLFAASFYLLTRYEEYFDYTPDQYGRFEATESLLFKYQLLDRPLINEWAESLKQIILIKHPKTPFKSNRFSFKISIDLDQAFAFRHRGIKRNILSLAKNLLRRNKMFLQSQVKTFFLRQDPFDTFDYLRDMQLRYKLPFIYFINVGAYSKYDKNIPVTKHAFRNILNSIKTHAEIGLHPSYFSNTQPQKFREEKEALEQCVEQPIVKSRQHFLKLQFPATYHHLIAIGITEDYTMGYASHPGFRAGTCSTFQWFDLQKNSATPLKIFPVVYMENTFAEDLQLSPDGAFQYITKLTDTVLFYKGCHISIWHNHTVNDQLMWKGWKDTFEKSIQYLTHVLC